MKKLLSIVLAVLMVVTLIPVGVFAAVSTSSAITATDGWYTDATTLTIDSVEDLWAFMKSGQTFSGKTVKLDCDLDVNAGWTASLNASAPTNQWTPLATFAGTFDGQGYSIRGLYVSTAATYTGFVGKLTGKINNLAIENAYVTSSQQYTGTFAGEIGAGASINNCYTDAYVVSSNANVGGFVGSQGGADVKFIGCWFNGFLSAEGSYSSGILGNQQWKKATFTDCLNTGTIRSSKNCAGISNAVYAGQIDATNVINLGEVRNFAGVNPVCSAIAYTIGGDASSAEGTAAKDCIWTNVYALEGSASKLEPIDVRGLSKIILNGTTYTKYTTDNLAELGAAMKIAKGSIADAGKYAGIDFNGGTWVMDEGGPELAAWSSRQPKKYITSAETLLAWTNNGCSENGWKVVLEADVVLNAEDASTYPTTAPATVWAPKDFYGDFDGQGHSISGLYYNNTSTNYVGFVKYLNDGSISNLTIKNSYIAGQMNVGAFVGQIHGTKGSIIHNCKSEATVYGKSNNVGGIAGGIAATLGTNVSVFSKCWNAGNVHTDQRYVSGIVANQESRSAQFVNCLNTGVITSAVKSIVAGGIAGSPYQGHDTSFVNCINLGSVYSTADGATEYGAISLRFYRVDKVTGFPFTNCYALEGTAKHLASENSGANELAGHYEWVAAAEKTTASAYDGINFGNGVWVMGANGPELNMAVNNDTLEISSYDQLVAWAKDTSDNSGQTVKLTNDIFANGDWTAKANFAGTFDGQGYQISGLKGGNALIKTLKGTGVIQNLSIVSSTFGSAGTNNVASFAAIAYGGAKLRNLYSDATVNGNNHMGGIVALLSAYDANNPVSFDTCWFNGSVTATNRYAAGILGNNSHGHAVITDCLNTGSVTSTTWADNNVCIAGIAAAVYDDRYKEGNGPGSVVLTNCVNLGKITATKGSATVMTGGLLGRVETSEYNENRGATYSMTNCYVLDGSANYNVHGLLMRDYGVGAKVISENDILDMNLPGWVPTENKGEEILAPAVLVETGYKYRIFTEEDLCALKNIATPESFTILLMNDITLTDPAAFSTIYLHNGSVFDGNGYTISGLTKAFISTVRETAVVKNVNFKDCTLSNYLIQNVNGTVDGVTLTNVNATYLANAVNGTSSADAVVKNVVMKGCSMTSMANNVYRYATIDSCSADSACVFTKASFAFYAYNDALFRNLYSAATVNGAGGMVADQGFYLADGTAQKEAGDNLDYVPGAITFDGCWFDGVLNATGWAGGFMGNINLNDDRIVNAVQANFSDCLYTGVVNSSSSNGSYAGFHGSIYTHSISLTNCVSLGTFGGTKAPTSSAMFFMSLKNGPDPATQNVTGTLTNCYSINGNASNGAYTEWGSSRDVEVTGTSTDLTNADSAAYEAMVETLGWSWFVRDNGDKVPVPAQFSNLLEVSDYTDAAPEKEDMIFVGWYTDPSCTERYTETGGLAYPKFVDEAMLEVSAQIKSNGDGKASIRFMSTVDTLDYESVKIEITRLTDGKTYGREISFVYEKLISDKETLNASQISGTADSKYIFTYVINNIPEANFGTEFAARAIITMNDGTQIVGNSYGCANVNLLA